MAAFPFTWPLNCVEGVGCEGLPIAAKECDVPAASFLKYSYLAWLSKPKADRQIYRGMRLIKPASIVELGVGSALRTRRIIEVAQRFRPDSPLHYTGIDLFEARPAELPGLSLKQAHQVLGATGVKVRLVPGDPLMALSRAANTLTQTDLVIIDASQDRAALAKAWFYVPRMLHADSVVFLEEPVQGGPTAFRRISLDQIAELAAAANARTTKRAA